MQMKMIGFDPATSSAIVSIDGAKQRVTGKERGAHVDLLSIQGSGFLVYTGRANKKTGEIDYRLASHVIAELDRVRVRRRVKLPIPSDCSILSQRGRGIAAVALAMLDNSSSVSAE